MNEPHQGKDPPDDRAKGGQPPVLDEEARGKLLMALAIGLSQREAGAWVGCSHTTVANVVRQSEEFRQELWFYKRLVRLHPHLCLYQAASKSWRAAACLVEHLERRHGKLSTDELMDALQVMRHNAYVSVE